MTSGAHNPRMAEVMEVAKRIAGRPRRRDPPRLTRILFASDFSPASRPAFAVARRLAGALHARLILFHAYESVVPAALGAAMTATIPPPSLVDDVWAEARQAGQQGLERLAAARKDDLHVRVRLDAGAPATAIVRAARRERAEVLVLGTHGRSGLRRLLLGSVAERVVRTAPCPVVTVPA
jgi:universal stress protein A